MAELQPRYPAWSPDRQFDPQEPVYAERFCACGGIFRMRARAGDMGMHVASFEHRHWQSNGGFPGKTCAPATKAEALAEHDRLAFASRLEATTKAAQAEGLEGGELAARVQEFVASYQPRQRPNFDVNASAED